MEQRSFAVNTSPVSRLEAGRGQRPWEPKGYVLISRISKTLLLAQKVLKSSPRAHQSSFLARVKIKSNSSRMSNGYVRRLSGDFLTGG